MFFAGLLAACATVPSSIVQSPTSIKPKPVSVVAPANGAIFQAASYRPLFEDRRARMVGDLLIISISESTSAAKAAASSADKSGSVSATGPQISGVGLGLLQQLSHKPLNALQGTSSLSGGSALKSDEKGAETASNTFTGAISVTVIDVLANGNLVVSGEKQVALDKGIEFIRFSGVVNPDTITSANTVSSTQVADARFEYRTNSRVDQAQVMSMFSRFFNSMLPL